MVSGIADAKHEIMVLAIWPGIGLPSEASGCVKNVSQAARLRQRGEDEKACPGLFAFAEMEGCLIGASDGSRSCLDERT